MSRILLEITKFMFFLFKLDLKAKFEFSEIKLTLI